MTVPVSPEDEAIVADRKPDAAEGITAEPFRVISQQLAAEQCYPDFESLYAHDREYYSAIYEFDGDVPLRLVGTDGGEPEDQSLFRDWKWVAVELNKMARYRAAAMASGRADGLREAAGMVRVEAMKRSGSSQAAPLNIVADRLESLASNPGV